MYVHSCSRNTVYVRASKCKWNLLIEFSGAASNHRSVSWGLVHEGWVARRALEEKKKGWLRSRFDVSTAFRSACYSRIIVTGRTERMRGASSIFTLYIEASRVPSQMETNLYAWGGGKKRALLVNWIDRLFLAFFNLVPTTVFTRELFRFSPTSASILHPRSLCWSSVLRFLVNKIFALASNQEYCCAFVMEIKLIANWKLYWDDWM